ncbi:MAG: hypothetical protein ACUVYA_20785, partial [Planctomycetota bacterium]
WRNYLYANVLSCGPKATLSVPGESWADCRTALPVYLESSEAVRGFSFGLTYPRTVGRLVGIERGSAFGGIAPATWDADLSAPACEPGLEGASLGCMISADASRELPPGRHEVARLVFERTVADREKHCGWGLLEFRDACIGDPPVSLVVVTPSGDVVPETQGGTLIPGESCFLRGDADSNGKLTIGDPVKIIYSMFREEPIFCRDALDADDDGEISVNDAISVIGYLFRHWAPPPAPFPEAGTDPTEDPLDCEFCGE